MTTTTRRLGTLVAMVVLSACGPAAPTLRALQVTPVLDSTAAGLPIELKATAIFSDASRRDVTASASWSSSDATVATVAGGKVSTLAPGAVTVTASLEALSAQASLSVTDAILVAVEVLASRQALPLGAGMTVAAVGQLSDGTTRDLTASAAWTASNGGLAVAADGAVLARAVGSTTASASFGGLTGSVEVSVTAAEVTGLQLVSDCAQLPVGLQARVTVVATYTDGSSLDVTGDGNVTSSNPDVATVEAAATVPAGATVRAVAAGTTFITAGFAGKQALSEFLVTPADLTSLRLSPPAAAVAAGQTVAFQVFGTYTNGAEYDLTGQATFAVADGALAAVSNAAGTLGTVTGLGGGATTVQAVIPGSPVEATAALTVTAPVLKKLAFNVKRVTLTVGGAPQQLVVTGTFADNSSADVTALVSWANLDPSFATVDGGLVTPLKAGVTILNAYDPAQPLAVNRSIIVTVY